MYASLLSSLTVTNFLVCDATTTCNGHGTCDASGSCVCDSGFALPYCTNCPTSYYGPNCATCMSLITRLFYGFIYAFLYLDCDPTATCSRNGQCSIDGTCACAVNYAGPNCASCASNYYGSNCETCTPSSLLFSHSNIIFSLQCTDNLQWTRNVWREWIVYV
jgi:hypothetical protein